MQKVQCCVIYKWILMALLLGVVLGTGCMHRQVVISDGDVIVEKDGLKTSFYRYWEFIAGKEVDKAFACESPYVQEMVEVGHYRNYKNLVTPGDLQEVKVLGMSCEQPFLCCLDCRMTYSVGNEKVERELRDCWVLVSGDWYHVFKNPLLFP